MTKKKQRSNCYDVCIVGAGPAGLAVLSAIREAYSINHLTEPQMQRALNSLQSYEQLSVCVIDPQPDWLHGWKSNFENLRIQHLRSPAMAHPDMFDTNALLAYATQQGREETELCESGCFEIKRLLGLGETQVGLWKLPSTKLFTDFCEEMVKRLPHDYVQGHVEDVERDDDDEDHGVYRVKLVADATKRTLEARSVILATGISGFPVIPPGLANSPRLQSWKDPKSFPPPPHIHQYSEHVLVVGGGLTAIQAALRVVEDGHTCVLCSRRPLQEKHFDIPVEWFDRRNTNQRLSNIYHDTPESRISKLQEARDGGSVPPMYMRRLEQAIVRGRLTSWVGDVEESTCRRSDEGTLVNSDGGNEAIQVVFEGRQHEFDRVILACGVKADCHAHPVLSKLVKKWPIPLHSGMPLLTEDLQWDADKHSNLFVVGGMSALQVGPDAGNLMGIRRAASNVSNALRCGCWLRENALSNRFEMLLWDESETEDESSDSD